MPGLTDQLVTVGLPWRRLLGGGVELVVEQTESFLAAARGSREQRAVTDREFDFYVHAVRRTSLDERRPQPIVHVVVRDVADNVAPPIDAPVEVRERLFHPLQSSQNTRDDLNFVMLDSRSPKEREDKGRGTFSRPAAPDLSYARAESTAIR